MNEHLFSYGTLQDEPIQLKTFGRLLEGYPDSLPGYMMGKVKIKDPAVIASAGITHYNNILFTGNTSDIILGTVFTITEEELERADEYEAADDYERMSVTLSSGKTAWVFHFAAQ
jgi:gamma-glutamylcyclotransferase (GGCT)/AIG2-like uncharacterized protein YtfP